MFSLDQNAAVQVNGGGNRISESGIYKGKITRAEWSSSQSSQAAFINIDFKSDDGMEANYMSICYQKGDGQQAFGYKTLMAIMAVCGVQNITQASHNGKTICPELTDKAIALALQAESDWYQDKNTNEWKPTTNMHIYVPFERATGKTAKEKLQNLEAKTHLTLKVNDKKPKPQPMPTQYEHQQSQAQYSDVPEFSDNIPF